MASAERILERFDWSAAGSPVEARSVAATLAEALPLGGEDLPLARGFMEADLTLAALEPASLVVVRRRVFRNVVQRIPLETISGVNRDDEWKRIALEIVGPRPPLLLRLTAEPMCEIFIRRLQERVSPPQGITFENALVRKPRKGNL